MDADLVFNAVFLRRFHIPILTVFLSISCILVCFRVKVFWSNGERQWRSSAGLSVAFSLTATVLFLLYYIFSAGDVALQLEIEDLFLKHEDALNQTVSYGEFLAGLPKTDLLVLQNMLFSQIWMLSANRVLLVTILWATKGSLLAIYLQSSNLLGRKTRCLLQGTGPFLFITLIFLVWNTFHEEMMVFGNWYPSAEELRHNSAASSSTGRLINDLPQDWAEGLSSILNLLTDVMLTFLAYKLIRALRRPVSTGWLLYLMGSVTISVAIIRVVFVSVWALRRDNWFPQGINELDWSFLSFVFTAECEVFSALVVSSLPGLRAFFRASGSKEIEYESQALLDR